MRRIVGLMLVGMVLSAGCGENASPTSDPHAHDVKPTAASAGLEQPKPETPAFNPSPTKSPTKSPTGSADGGELEMNGIAAVVNGQPLLMREVVRPLIEAHGLTVLINLVRLEVAKDAALKKNITVTSKDFDDEHELALDKLLKNSDDTKLSDALARAEAEHNDKIAADIRAEIKQEREDVLTQYLEQQHIDRVEFDLVMKLNAYLRKNAEPQVVPQMTEEALKRAFGQMYGEKIRVRYVELQNMDEVGKAKRRLAVGEPFENVARDMSHNRQSGLLGGECPAFTREASGVPKSFSDTAFALKDGEVSDPVSIGQVIFLIKRVELIAPKIVKYESVKQHVYKTLYNAVLDELIKKLRQEVDSQTLVAMQIKEPVLARQFDDKTNHQKYAEERAKAALARKQRVVDWMNPRHAFTLPSTLPTTLPTTRGTASTPDAAPQADPAAAGERPPATQPGPATLPAIPTTAPSTLR